MKNGKAVIVERNGKLIVTMPSKKNWLVLLFATACMVGWGFVVNYMIGDIIYYIKDGTYNYGDYIMWIIEMLIIGIMNISFLLWGYFGKERIKIIGEELFVQKTIFGIGMRKKLKLALVTNFRLNTMQRNAFAQKKFIEFGDIGGKIKFDYGMRTYTIGQAIDEAEANFLIDKLKVRTGKEEELVELVEEVQVEEILWNFEGL